VRLPESLAAARAAVDAAGTAPQSRKKAMLAALLIDGAVDALFEASGDDDVLAFRAALSRRRPALQPILDVVAMAESGAKLVIKPIEVAIGDYPALGVEDFMVSLYNDRTVPRVVIAWPDGRWLDVHISLADALAALSAKQP
jgi:hypothetical protein